MKTTRDYLIELQKKTGETPNALARLLKIKSPTMYDYLNHGNPMTPTVALRVAALLGIPWPIVIADVKAEAAKKEQDREDWNDAAKRARRSMYIMSNNIREPEQRHAA